MAIAKVSCKVLQEAYQEGSNSVISSGCSFNENFGMLGGAYKNLRRAYQEGVWHMCGELNTYEEISSYRFPNTI